jgi:hypothetical protein
MRRSSPPQRQSLAHAPPAGWAPPSLTRRRLLDPHRSTLGAPDSSSIAGRRASGFLQLSLSKVSRHPHRSASRDSSAETPPRNANDFRGVNFVHILWPHGGEAAFSIVRRLRRTTNAEKTHFISTRRGRRYTPPAYVRSSRSYRSDPSGRGGDKRMGPARAEGAREDKMFVCIASHKSAEPNSLLSC